MSLLSGNHKDKKKGDKAKAKKPNNVQTPKPGKAANFSKTTVRTGGTRGS